LSDCITAIVASIVLISAVSAYNIEQRYVTRWNVEPIIRFSLDRDIQANYAKCRLEGGPAAGVVIHGRVVGNIHGRTVWQIPAANVPPGTYEVTHDLRTPLGAELIKGTVVVPQIARHTGSTKSVRSLSKWPQDSHPRITQDAGPVEFAWDRNNLYVRLPKGAKSPLQIVLDVLPVVPERYTKLISVEKQTAVPWSSLFPAGPHIGQVLKYRVLPEDKEVQEILFVGSGENIYFGATIVGSMGDDDQGPPIPILEALVDLSGLDLRSVGVEWRDVEKQDPGNGPSQYDWSALRRNANNYKPGLVYAGIGLWNEWANKVKESDPARYRKLAQRFVEAAAKEYASLGIKHFSLGFNEPEMFFRSDKEAYFVQDLNLSAEAVRRAVPDAKIIAGKFSSGDPPLIRAFYSKGFKDNFDVLDIHPYNNDPRTGTAMGEIVASHDTLEELGMGYKRIYLGEGWGPTRNLHQVPRADFDAPVSPEEADCHRQFYQNGYRELITPRMDYSPDWVLGAKYFTLNDNVGGTYWKQAARPVKNSKGEIEYYLIGELRFDNPDTLKAFFCNGGLVDFFGNPKGTWFYDFPPALPEVRVLASGVPKYVLHNEWHEIKVAVTNGNPRPIANVKLGVRHQTGRWDGQLSAEAVGAVEKDVIAPGEVWRTSVKVKVNKGRVGPLRIALEVDYTYDGDVYMTDDVVRTELRLPLDVNTSTPVVSLDNTLQPVQVKTTIRNNTRQQVDLRPTVGDVDELEVISAPDALTLKPGGSATVVMTIRPRNPEPGAHFVPIVPGSDENITVMMPYTCPRALVPPKIDGDIRDWPAEALRVGSIKLGGSVSKEARPADYPFPEPPPVEQSAIGKTVTIGPFEPDAPAFGADVAFMWDDKNLYFMAVVENKNFVQNYSGTEVWRQDSIQIAFDPLDNGAGNRTVSGAQFAAKTSEEYYSADDYEYALALTKDGPVITRIVAPPGMNTGYQKLGKVAVRHENGLTYYEAALPWELLAPYKPESGKRFRVEITVNNYENDDRYTLGWVRAIRAGKFPSRFVPVILEP